jgi:hypothetical protein
MLMTDETQVNRNDGILNDDESRQNALNLEEQRRQLIEERWVATHVLAYHLEIESMLGSMLRQTLPKPDRFLDRPGAGPTFAQELAVCDSLGLLDDKLVVAIRALNRLRNSYAHTPGQELELPELARFLAAVHGMHGVSVRPTPGGQPVDVTSYENLLAHFETHGTEDVEGLLFIALRLLRAHVATMFSNEPPEESEPPPNTPLQPTAEKRGG